MIEGKHLFSELSLSYARRDFAAVAGRYDAPGAIYLEDDVIVWPSREWLRSFLETQCAVNRDRGVYRVEAEFVTQCSDSEVHFSTWIRWHYQDARGDEVLVMPARYYCRRAESGRSVIQLVEIPKRPHIYSRGDIDSLLRRSGARAEQNFALTH